MEFVSGQLPGFPQLSADHLSRAPLGSAAGPYPVHGHLVGDESFHGVGHIREPGASAQLAVGENREPRLALAFERRKNRSLFDGVKLFGAELAPRVFGASLQELRWSQEASNILSAKAWRHFHLREVPKARTVISSRPAKLVRGRAYQAPRSGVLISGMNRRRVAFATGKD